MASHQASICQTLIHRITKAAICLLLLTTTFASLALAEGYRVKPTSFDQVTLSDSFWLPRLQTQRRVLVPYAFEKTSEAQADLEAAALFLAGKKVENMPGPHRFRTSDLFKVMEGAAYLLAIEGDPRLEKQMDQLIVTIGGSQEPDGYINPTRTLYPHDELDMMGNGRYSYVIHSHEVYNMGHLYEAAVAYYHATGKRQLLDIAEKNALHLRRAFFEGDPNHNDGKPINQAPGHQETELALVRLAEATGNPIHLDTAKRFLDVRGVTFIPNGEGVNTPSYAQQHLPVAEQTEPTGHAVRATYLYAGMADVGAKLNDDIYTPALNAIWENMVDTRMHLTGGLGAVHGIEGFGEAFDLPNHDAFNETCAAVGNVFFNWRMFLLHNDAKYLDVAELALYNNALAGMNLAGDRFFYVNPLAADGTHPFNHGHAGRAPWFGTACCPTNLARLIPQIPGMLFAKDQQGLTLCLYAASETTMDIAGQSVELKEETNYPFDGEVRLTLTPNSAVKFPVRLRIPTWTTDQLTPGKLYHYAEPTTEAVKIFVNDKPVSFSVERGFATVEQTWKPGDEIRLELPMPVQVNTCRSEVKANRGRVAISRGPLVYCAEAIDNAHHLTSYLLQKYNAVDSAKIAPVTFAGHDTVAISINAEHLNPSKATEQTTLTLVPYYAWNNRGAAAMEVWLPDNRQTAIDNVVVIDDNANRFSSVEATHTHHEDRQEAMIDGRIPKSSSDTSVTRWTSWPEKGKPQTIDFTLTAPTKVRSIDVYWYEDKGGVQTPARWELQIMEQGQWKPFPLYNTDAYNVLLDQFNIVHPARPLTIDRLRLKVWPKPDAAAGILELAVRPETN